MFWESPWIHQVHAGPSHWADFRCPKSLTVKSISSGTSLTPRATTPLCWEGASRELPRAQNTAHSKPVVVPLEAFPRRGLQVPVGHKPRQAGSTVLTLEQEVIPHRGGSPGRRCTLCPASSSTRHSEGHVLTPEFSSSDLRARPLTVKLDVGFGPRSLMLRCLYVHPDQGQWRPTQS